MRARLSLPILATLVVFVLTPVALEAAVRPITFTNNTGQLADDLHVEFDQAASPHPPAGPWGPFTANNPSGANEHHFSGGNVNAGGSVTITFTNSGPKITIKSWWWTRGGRRISPIMGERAVAMVHFDQDSARPAEALTVNLYALAGYDQAASLEVRYSISNPDGSVASRAPFVLDVEAGTGQHQELEVLEVSLPGTYTLSYESTDLVTGEVQVGSSTVEVDEGVFTRETSDPDGVQTVN